MTQHAKGTFTVDIQPISPAPAAGLSRFSINKQIHGDLEATTQGEMYSGGDPKRGAAGYVAIEVVSGTLKGKRGTFAMQQMATMDAKGPEISIVIVPGSGTEELEGITGKLVLEVKEGRHSYDLEYVLPEHPPIQQ